MANETREDLAVGMFNMIASTEGKAPGSPGVDREYILNLYAEVFATIDGKREVKVSDAALLRPVAGTTSSASAHTGYGRRN